MKSSVINSGNGGGGSNPQQHPPNATTSAQIDGNNNPQQGQPNQGQNPRYPFYDFDMDDPRDFFTNPALRSRLNRMRNPWNVSFGAPRKRPNQAPEEEDSGFVEDPHESFFTKFDPHWSEASQWPRSNLRKRQPNDFGGHGDFFDHFPAEFRQYIPDDFGFHHQPMGGYHGHQVPMTHQVPTQRQVPPHTDKPDRPRFCDAAMQTDEEPPTRDGATETVAETPTQTSAEAGGPLKQHGLRNTVDLGQKSPPEEREERAKSAPPDAEAQAEEVHTKGVQSEAPEQHQAPPSPSQNVRHIPIIVERTEKKAPVPQPPKRGVSQKKFVLRPQGGAPTDAGTSPPPQEVPQAPQSPQAPPTPSAESIAKIQQIQNEVLELMFKVEAFQGTSRTDKEYLWLDEMLTRNLLKLDTIDTQGNDRIRLARREAIKCIQASLAVLEAKAEGTAKSVPDSEEQSTAEGPKENQEDTKDQQTVPEETSANLAKPDEAPEEVDKSKIPIPLPPIEPRTEQVPAEGEKSEEGKEPPKEEEGKTEAKTKKKKIVKKVVKDAEGSVQNEDQQT
uniref:Putative bag family molecular chaperone regulator 3 n=1 Tax=Lutzomyia longipalpis TaxID=7200 RepID=A0A1B0C9F6_LUTLO